MPFIQLHPHVPQPFCIQRYRSPSSRLAMAKAPEDMTFEDLEEAVAGYCCRALTAPFVSGALPLGSWNHVNFPLADLEAHDVNPAMHYIDIITDHSMNISFEDLALQYKTAIMHKDLTCSIAHLVPRCLFQRRQSCRLLSLTPWMAQSLSSSITSSHRNASPLCQEHQLWALVQAKPHEPKIHCWEKVSSVLLAEHGWASVSLLWHPHWGSTWPFENQGVRWPGRWRLGQGVWLPQAACALQQHRSPTAFLANKTATQEIVSYLWVATGSRWKGLAVFVFRWRPCPQRIWLAIAIDWQVLSQMDLAHLRGSLEFRRGFFGHAWGAEHWQAPTLP